MANLTTTQRQAANAKILALIATFTFKEFDETDWDAFAGCTSEKPLIAENEDTVIIIDGDQIIVVTESGGCETTYTLREEVHPR